MKKDNQNMFDNTANVLVVKNVSVCFTKKYLHNKNSSKNLSKKPNKNPNKNPTPQYILQDISFKMKAGEKIAIVGDSGSGKTTLLRAIAQVLHTNMQRFGEIIYSNKKPAYIMQESKSALNPLCSVKTLFKDAILHTNTNINSEKKSTQKHIKKHTKEYIINTTKNALQKVHLPTDNIFLKKRSLQLSGGMAQRLMIALVLVAGAGTGFGFGTGTGTGTVLADEASSSLDVYHEKKILDTLCNLMQSVLMVTHTMELVKRYCTKVLVLKKGKMVFFDSVKVFFNDSFTSIPANLNTHNLKKHAVLISTNTHNKKTHNKDIVLNVSNISFAYQKKQKNQINNVTMQIHKAQMIYIRGETGSGKSTLAALLSGFRKPNEGSIQFNGQALGYSMSKTHRKMRAQIQLVPQVPTLCFNPLRSVKMSIEDVIKDESVRVMCEFVDLDYNILDHMPDELSSGQLQRASCIRALLMNPKLLILDEPVSHLDVKARPQMLNLICDIQKRTNIAVCIITHLQEVHTYIKKIHKVDAQYVLHDGRIL